MSDADEKLRALAKAATPGPWRFSGADAEFIAAANPVVVLSLLDRLAAVEAERDQLRQRFLAEQTRADLREAERDQALQALQGVTRQRDLHRNLRTAMLQHIIDSGAGPDDLIQVAGILGGLLVSDRAPTAGDHQRADEVWAYLYQGGPTPTVKPAALAVPVGVPAEPGETLQSALGPSDEQMEAGRQQIVADFKRIEDAERAAHIAARDVVIGAPSGVPAEQPQTCEHDKTEAHWYVDNRPLTIFSAWCPGPVAEPLVADPPAAQRKRCTGLNCDRVEGHPGMHQRRCYASPGCTERHQHRGAHTTALWSPLAQGWAVADPPVTCPHGEIGEHFVQTATGGFTSVICVGPQPEMDQRLAESMDGYLDNAPAADPQED